MSTNRTNAGVAGAGADVIDVVSTGPYSISSGDSIKVAFALIAGDDLTDIQTSAVNAQLMYDGLLTTGISQASSDNSMRVFPNPTSGMSEIMITSAEAGKAELKIFDLTGKEIKEIVSENITEGTHHFSFDTAGLTNGIYYYQLQIGARKYVQKLIVVR